MPAQVCFIAVQVNLVKESHFYLLHLFPAESVIWSHADSDLIAHSVNLSRDFNTECCRLCFSKTQKSSLELLLVTHFLWIQHLRRHKMRHGIPYDNLAPPSKIWTLQVFVNFDHLTCVYRNELRAHLPMEKRNLWEPPLSSHHAGGDRLSWHLKAEWEWELPNLTLVLVWC